MGLARSTLVALLAFGLFPQFAVAVPHCPVRIEQIPDKPPIFIRQGRKGVTIDTQTPTVSVRL